MRYQTQNVQWLTYKRPFVWLLSFCEEYQLLHVLSSQVNSHHWPAKNRKHCKTSRHSNLKCYIWTASDHLVFWKKGKSSFFLICNSITHKCLLKICFLSKIMYTLNIKVNWSAEFIKNFSMHFCIHYKEMVLSTL